MDGVPPLLSYLRNWTISWFEHVSLNLNVNKINNNSLLFLKVLLRSRMKVMDYIKNLHYTKFMFTIFMLVYDEVFILNWNTIFDSRPFNSGNPV